MFTCDICGQDGLSEPDMKIHILIAHDENECSCPFCSLDGINYDELMVHIDISHNETEPIHNGNLTGKDNYLHSSMWTNGMSQSKVENTLGHKESKVERVKETKSEEFPMSNSNSGFKKLERQSLPRKRESGRSVLSDTSCGHFSGTVQKQPEKDQHRKRSEKKGMYGSSEEFGKTDAPECPFCGLLGTSGDDLNEHVKIQHAKLMENPSKGCRKEAVYPCPICSLVFASCQILQEHVDLHLAENRPEEFLLADRQLAQKLQEEEERLRRLNEAKREQVEFQKLQMQYGLDNQGGYKQQAFQNMERAVERGQMNPAEYHRRRAAIMESLALGEDDGRTKTSGLIKALNEYYQRCGTEVRRVFLCAETNHYHASIGDKGWGCGYRNLQMLLSSFMKIEQFKHHLHDMMVIPSIPKLQSMIEETWKRGFDPQGAAHFKNKLQGTRAWIGATEIYSLLTFLRVKCRIIDFHRPTGPGGTHPQLFEWIKQYFSSGRDTGLTLHPRVIWTNKTPIYLQHQGHSRTIVGIEERNNGSLCLLIFDPGSHCEAMQKLLLHDMNAGHLKMIRRFIGSMKHKQYQIVAVDGFLSVEEKNARKQASAVLTAEKVP
ncbi:zinc finger-containing ubiquitin peptidase 1 isoform X1 [Callorhinchus milii]|uniref:zinc finger-containing ubiquitin peptidase 1 isoform X1 n=1 Tax=Callorhinchus milii TaxID=7868 RepID=UPI0004571DB7|nr:zinc finger-containing ubiquitin peptidase 1 isoform X1 [Callorhinchus milii]|eukprot:gi/632983196/ref/XP_007908528.1/ PREDICTED: zinc finger with UFM1-specific peptidase domain protein [Callorhinchus milii]